MNIYNLYRRYCQHLKENNIYRQLPSEVNNNLLDFTSNDYLNFSVNDQILLAARQASEIYGVGSTGSRLISGNNELFEEFEAQIARDKNTEDAMIFVSGFQANFSALSSLLDKKVLGGQAMVFFDKANHSSLYQAVFLSGAKMVRYRHNDMEHLEDLMKKYKDDNSPKFIVAETVHGMDGDLVDMEGIIYIAAKYKAFLYLDEAHATGVFGGKGYGLSTDYSLKDVPHVIMGTFSKALGAQGAYIACSKHIKDYLVNKATGFIYSTAPSPLVIAAARKAWELIKDMDVKRTSLLELSSFLREGLKGMGFNTGKSNSHIVPVIIGSDHEVGDKADKLRVHGILVYPVRSPTVSQGSARLRISLTLKHTKDDVLRLLEALGHTSVLSSRGLTTGSIK